MHSLGIEYGQRVPPPQAKQLSIQRHNISALVRVESEYIHITRRLWKEELSPIKAFNIVRTVTEVGSQVVMALHQGHCQVPSKVLPESFYEGEFSTVHPPFIEVF